MSQPFLFDLAELAAAEAISVPWAGAAPLCYTTEFHTPAEFDAAMARWHQETTVRNVGMSHMWHHGWAAPTHTEGHVAVLYLAETRLMNPGCGHEHPADWPDALMYQMICEGCRWHHIATSENAVVEAWHDHALPGWRDLPILPAKISTQKQARVLAWLEDTYPPEWVRPGVPIRTHRSQHGTRHVPGRSPLGGYDLTAVVEAAR